MQDWSCMHASLECFSMAQDVHAQKMVSRGLCQSHAMAGRQQLTTTSPAYDKQSLQTSITEAQQTRGKEQQHNMQEAQQHASTACMESDPHARCTATPGPCTATTARQPQDAATATPPATPPATPSATPPATPPHATAATATPAAHATGPPAATASSEEVYALRLQLEQSAEELAETRQQLAILQEHMDGMASSNAEAQLSHIDLLSQVKHLQAKLESTRAFLVLAMDEGRATRKDVYQLSAEVDRLYSPDVAVDRVYRQNLDADVDRQYSRGSAGDLAAVYSRGILSAELNEQYSCGTGEPEAEKMRPGAEWGSFCGAGSSRFDRRDTADRAELETVQSFQGRGVDPCTSSASSGLQSGCSVETAVGMRQCCDGSGIGHSAEAVLTVGSSCGRTRHMASGRLHGSAEIEPCTPTEPDPIQALVAEAVQQSNGIQMTASTAAAIAAPPSAAAPAPPSAAAAAASAGGSCAKATVRTWTWWGGYTELPATRTRR